MLPSFKNAYCVFGKVQKTVAAECGVTDRTFYKWATGRAPCPVHKRQSVDRALGGDDDPAARVDWDQYKVEYAACQRAKSAGPAPEPPAQAAGWPTGDAGAAAAPTRPQRRQSAPEAANEGWGFV